MSKSTTQSTGPINGADSITIELIQPNTNPPVVRLTWPAAPTITTPAKYTEAAAAAMKVLAAAVTELSRIRASKRL